MEPIPATKRQEPTVPAAFAAVVDARPGDAALVVQGPDSDEVWSWERLSRAAGGVAEALAELPAGSAVALLGENRPEWCAAWLGVVGAGHAAVPLDPGLNPEALSQQVADSAVALVLSTERHATNAEKLGVPVRVMERVPPGERLRPVDAAPTDRALILYTSGTTARPKGVVLSHGNLSATVGGLARSLPATSEDVSLAVLPLFHILAQLTGILVPLSVGAKVVLLAELSPAEILRALQAQGVTIFCCVPQFFYVVYQRVREQVAKGGPRGVAIFERLLRLCGWIRANTGLNPGRRVFKKVHAVFGSKMRLLITGGARFEPSVAADFKALGFELLQGYGLTECTGNATITRLGDNPLGSVGRPTGDNEVRVDAEGEVWVRGPSVMVGYHGRPDLNAEVLQDGWLRTGDLGHLDPAGHLFVTGRKTDLIVLPNGKKLSPEELEAHYAKAPFIAELCVFPMSGPGGALRLHAAIVPDRAAAAAAGVVDLPERLRYEIEERSALLPAWQRVVGFDLLSSELPRTTTRKLIRHAVEALVRAEAAPAARPWSEEERAWAAQPRVSAALATIAEAVERETPIHPEDRLDLDLGLDSLGRISLLATLQERAGVRLPSTEGLMTVRAAVDALGSAGPAPSEVEVPTPSSLVVLLGFLFVRAFALLAGLLLPLRVRGLENLPPAPFLLAPNHQSLPDPLFVIGRLPFAQFKQLFFVGKRKYFRGVWARFGGWLGVVLVDGEGGLEASLAACAAGLRQGRSLLLFPEGERTLTGELREFRSGAARIAREAGAPIVPVRIEGAFEMWPRGGRFQGFKPVTVSFGPPLQAGEDPAQTTAMLQEAVRSLGARALLG